MIKVGVCFLDSINHSLTRTKKYKVQNKSSGFLVLINPSLFIKFEIGPSFNFLVNDQYQYKYDSYTRSDLAEKFELGGVVGLSYKVKSNFFVNTNYLIGFSNTLKSPFENSKNYGFSAGIGYLFK